MVVKDPEEKMALDNIEEFLSDDGKIVSLFSQQFSHDEN